MVHFEAEMGLRTNSLYNYAIEVSSLFVNNNNYDDDEDNHNTI